MCSKPLQSCLTFYNPLDYSLPGFSVHGALQARILEWVGYALLQGIFPTQGWITPQPPAPSLFSPALARWVLYYWCHPGSIPNTTVSVL